tara:strand:- start:103 stop:468 length:366 start_codon:yes stop_codon:yes gene_type:complete
MEITMKRQFKSKLESHVETEKDKEVLPSHHRNLNLPEHRFTRLENRDRFIKDVFEIAYGDGAGDYGDRKYTYEEVISQLRQFSDDALRAPEKLYPCWNGLIHGPREEWIASINKENSNVKK